MRYASGERPPARAGTPDCPIIPPLPHSGERALLHRVFIDGQAGTTGLALAQRLVRHGGIEAIGIAECDRRSPEARRRAFRQADVVVLCLPDEAAREAVALAPDARFLDASTAHRVADGWTYGLPELAGGQRRRIAGADRVANPGCYPTGFVLAVRPLVDAGVLPPSVPLRVNAVSGYSGGGKTLIASYAGAKGCPGNAAPVRAYGLSLDHKHLPEMRAFAGIDVAPLFARAVGPYFQGMIVQVGLFASELEGDAATVHRVLDERYADEPFVHVPALNPGAGVLEDGFLSPTARNDSNHMDILVFGQGEQVLVVSRFDNLGKGAAGAAVQNLNLMLGLPETTGLEPWAPPRSL